MDVKAIMPDFYADQVKAGGRAVFIRNSDPCTTATSIDHNTVPDYMQANIAALHALLKVYQAVARQTYIKSLKASRLYDESIEYPAEAGFRYNFNLWKVGNLQVEVPRQHDRLPFIEVLARPENGFSICKDSAAVSRAVTEGKAAIIKGYESIDFYLPADISQKIKALAGGILQQAIKGITLSSPQEMASGNASLIQSQVDIDLLTTLNKTLTEPEKAAVGFKEAITELNRRKLALLGEAESLLTHNTGKALFKAPNRAR